MMCNAKPYPMFTVSFINKVVFFTGQLVTHDVTGVGGETFQEPF